MNDKYWVVYQKKEVQSNVSILTVFHCSAFRVRYFVFLFSAAFSESEQSNLEALIGGACRNCQNKDRHIYECYHQNPPVEPPTTACLGTKCLDSHIFYFECAVGTPQDCQTFEFLEGIRVEQVTKTSTCSSSDSGTSGFHQLPVCACEDPNNNYNVKCLTTACPGTVVNSGTIYVRNQCL